MGKWSPKEKWFADGIKLSRRAKKYIWGKRLSLNHIAKLLLIASRDGTDDPCAICGCIATKESYNEATYPEMWYCYYCARCGFLTGEYDNGIETYYNKHGEATDD